MLFFVPFCLFQDFKKSKDAEKDSHWSAVILRYFNPAGAHPSGLIGMRIIISSSTKALGEQRNRIFIVYYNHY